MSTSPRLIKELDHAKDLHRAGRHEDARRAYQKILSKYPSNREILSLCGALYIEMQRFDKAEELLARLVRLAADDADARYNYALSFYHQKKFDEAIAQHQEAVRIEPAHPSAYYMMARAFGKKTPPDYEAALRCCARDFELNDRTDAALYAAEMAAFCNAWEEMHRYSAIVMKRDPENYQGIFYMARAMLGTNYSENTIDIRHIESTIKLGQVLIRMSETDPRGYTVVAEALQLLQQDDLSASYFRKVIELDDSNMVAHTNLGILLLRNREFEEGWKQIAYRSYASTKFGINSGQFDLCPAPRWDGSVVSGKHLAVFGEQGIGDQMLHSQMVAQLIEAGMRISMTVDAKMIPLMSRSLPQVAFFNSKTPEPDPQLMTADFKCDLLELGQHLRTSLVSFDPVRHYLQPDPKLVAEFRERYAEFDGVLKVGISWKSTSQTTGTVKSSRLLDWAPILSVPGIQFFNLQYGDYDADINAVKEQLGIDIYRDTFNPFKDIERAVAQVAVMDLVISVSNATVHMAGQLNVPTWVLLATRPLWHWFIDGDTSVWYESLKLYRQRELETWAPLLNQVAADLASVVDA
jgi:tetratricopeptide (TPR) repeat protein